LPGVERAELAAGFVPKRGELPQAFQDREHIYVVPQDDLKLLVRLYAIYQAARGWTPPVIVRTVAPPLGELAGGLGAAGLSFQLMAFLQPCIAGAGWCSIRSL
jgi:hypothetical protein